MSERSPAPESGRSGRSTQLFRRYGPGASAHATKYQFGLNVQYGFGGGEVRAILRCCDCANLILTEAGERYTKRLRVVIGGVSSIIAFIDTINHASKGFRSILPWSWQWPDLENTN